MILKCTVFLVPYQWRDDSVFGCGIAGGCFTDIVVHSSMSYRQEHALPTGTEPRRLHKDVDAACGAVMLRFHGVYKPEMY